jgi:transcriptional regulator with XRE-family HTH domain
MKKNRRMDALKSHLSRNIKSLRVDSGLSQEELAEKAGISVPYLGAIERGEKWPGPAILNRIANALEVEPYTLLKPENAPSKEVRKIIEELSTDITALVSRSVKMLNNIEKDSGD